ncbi:MAG: hypothetical protein GF331_14075 [Chitinivibrionales bacterium]|nr:hypothetical protein [Chitinivibrionales bacterium]
MKRNVRQDTKAHATDTPVRQVVSWRFFFPGAMPRQEEGVERGSTRLDNRAIQVAESDRSMSNPKPDDTLECTLPSADTKGVMPQKQPERARHVYARVLLVFVPTAFGLTAMAFLLYITGALDPLISMAETARLWALGAGEALDVTGMEPGWDWLTRWYRADMLCLVALALLASATPVACAFASVQYFRRREWALGIIASVQVIILAIAMSGLVVAE